MSDRAHEPGAATPAEVSGHRSLEVEINLLRIHDRLWIRSSLPPAGPPAKPRPDPIVVVAGWGAASQISSIE